jgi:energy-coupling factor transport system ATP-binding protein
MNYESINFINASKIYNSGSAAEKKALNNITLTIKHGEFVGIAGMNGSGKSTLARMINGLILPSSGQVKVNGMSTGNRKDIKKIRSLVGMLFQNPDNQIISPIVEEDVAFGPINLGLSKQEVKERTDWALKVLGIEKLREHSPYMLSGGQKQKVAIASALAMKPSYLILDEPTSMLDNESRNEFLSTLKFLNSKFGITIVLISHLMEDMSDADRLIIMNKGEIYLDDIPWKLFSCPEKLKKAGISPPKIVCLLDKLRERGHEIDSNIITVNQMEEYICRLLK